MKKKFFSLLLVICLSFSLGINTFAASTYTISSTGSKLVYTGSDGVDYTYQYYLSRGSGYANYYGTIYMYEDANFIYLMLHTDDYNAIGSTRYSVYMRINGVNTQVSDIVGNYYVYKITRNGYFNGFTWSSLSALQSKYQSYIDTNGLDNQAVVWTSGTDTSASQCNDFYSVAVSSTPSGGSGGSGSSGDSGESVGLLKKILDAVLFIYNCFRDPVATAYPVISDLLGRLENVPVFGNIFGKLSDVYSFLGELKIKLNEWYDLLTWDITEGFDGLGDTLSNIKLTILEFPHIVLDGIKSIFIPDNEEIQVIFDDLVADIETKFDFYQFNFEELFSGEAKPHDPVEKYTIYGKSYNLKFVQYDYLEQGVIFFRPYIQGFLILMMLIFSIKQALAIFDIDIGISSGAPTGGTPHVSGGGDVPRIETRGFTMK